MNIFTLGHFLTLDHFLWFGCGFGACMIVNFLLARQYDRELARQHDQKTLDDAATADWMQKQATQSLWAAEGTRKVRRYISTGKDKP